MTTKLFNELTKDAQARFDKDIKNANVKRTLETQFGVRKPDPKLQKTNPTEYAAQKKHMMNLKHYLQLTEKI